MTGSQRAVLGKADGSSHAGLERGSGGETESRRAMLGNAGLGHVDLERVFFFFCFTALRHILGHFGNGQLP